MDDPDGSPQSAESLRLVANVSTLFPESAYLDRFAAAAAAGFQGVESWWPFPAPVPEEGELRAFLTAVAASGLPLVGLNLYAGDMGAGDRGTICRPDLQEAFAANLEAVVRIARHTGCSVFNALYGQRLPGRPAADLDELATGNLVHATRRLGDEGGAVLIESLTAGSAGAYPLVTAQDAVDVVERVRERSGSDRIGMLFDTHHLANNGDDLIEVIDRHSSLIQHVQVADTPGRGEPGSGALPIDAVVARLWDAGYRGAVSCEYLPTRHTTRTLCWIDGIPRLTLDADATGRPGVSPGPS